MTTAQLQRRLDSLHAHRAAAYAERDRLAAAGDRFAARHHDELAGALGVLLAQTRWALANGDVTWR